MANIEIICPICQSSIQVNDVSVECDQCNSQFHDDCWLENGGCAVYGCQNVPPTEKRSDLEVPVSYWGQEEKPCPVCERVILAAALRCRHCGTVFSSIKPENAVEYQQNLNTKNKFPELKRATVILFIMCIVPILSAIGSIWGTYWYCTNKQTIKQMPVIYSALSIIAICTGIGQTAFTVLIISCYSIINQ